MIHVRLMIQVSRKMRILQSRLSSKQFIKNLEFSIFFFFFILTIVRPNLLMILNLNSRLAASDQKVPNGNFNFSRRLVRAENWIGVPTRAD